MKRLKVMGIMVIVVAVACLLLGILFAAGADNCKGTMVITTGGYKGTIGANPEGEETLTMLSMLMYGMSVIWGIAAVIMFTKLSSIKKQPINKAMGTILEKENFIATIEFASGKRRKMTIEPDVLVTRGEKGEIRYKDKAGIVVGFKKSE